MNNKNILEFLNKSLNKRLDKVTAFYLSTQIEDIIGQLRAVQDTLEEFLTEEEKEIG